MTEGIPILPGKGGKQLEGVIPIAFLEPNVSGMTCHGRVLEVLRSEVRGQWKRLGAIRLLSKSYMSLLPL